MFGGVPIELFSLRNEKVKIFLKFDVIDVMP